MTLRDVADFYNKRVIWHFTDESNLESIYKHGLLSLEMIEKHNIDVSCYGANALSHDLDRHFGLSKYVHLSFIQEHPMCYIKKRDGLIPNPVWLAIDISVLTDDALFTTEVANKTGVPRYNIHQLPEKADLEVLWGRTDWRDSTIQQRRQKAKKGEILVPKLIESRYILNIKGAA